MSSNHGCARRRLPLPQRPQVPSVLVALLLVGVIPSHFHACSSYTAHAASLAVAFTSHTLILQYPRELALIFMGVIAVVAASSLLLRLVSRGRRIEWVLNAVCDSVTQVGTATCALFIAQ